MSLIGISAKSILFLCTSVLKHCSLGLLQNCKSYQLKREFCSNVLGILRYSQHKTEINNLSPVIRAQYVVNLLFEEIFGAVFSL
jgi:hypothetical protein